MGWIRTIVAASLIGWSGGAMGCGDADADDDAEHVDASGPGSADAAPAGEDPAYVFDDDALRTYELVIADADLATLEADPQAEQYVPAMLRFEGALYGPIGVRYKGGFGNLDSCFQDGVRVCDKLSIKLKFSEYDPDARFYGLKRLNFHSMKGDPAKLRDRLAYSLYQDVGVAAPRSVHARLLVNGELRGVFALVEQIDGRFTRMRFPDGGEGNLYKEVWPTHATEAPYLNALKTNEDESPTADKMVRFAADLANADDATFEAVLSSWMDVNELMRQLAVDRAIDHWDGIVAWYCVGGPCFNHNYYWYEDVAQDRVWLVPWDMDNTFAVPSPIRTQYGMPDWDEPTQNCAPRPVFLGITGLPPSCDDLLHRLATVMFDRYATATQALLDGPFQLAALEAKLDRWETQLTAAIAEDPNESLMQWFGAVQTLRNNLPQLRQHVADKL